MIKFARKCALPLGVAAMASAAVAVPALAGGSAYISHFNKIGTLGSMRPTHGSAKGDQNPYGVAVVPRSMGALVKGDVLVSNFNNSMNQQGTGKSIVEVSQSGHVRVFALVPRPHGSPAVGLTTALVALKSGFVIVGNLPAPGGTSSNARAGALTILNSQGHVVKTITGGDINGPWDMTAVDKGKHVMLFVTNVLNGTVAAGGMDVNHGTVVRIGLSIRPGKAPKVTSNQVIATGFTEHTDPNALVVGPTGVGVGSGGTLYVSDSAHNRIAAIPHALTRTSELGHAGKTLIAGHGVNDPLGLTIAPNGDVITANGGDGNIVEITPAGHPAAMKTLVSNGAGDLFGLAIVPGGHGLYFVNDAGSGPAANSLQILH